MCVCACVCMSVCVCVCVCGCLSPTRSWERNVVSPHFFHQCKLILLPSCTNCFTNSLHESEVWMLHLPFSSVSPCFFRQHKELCLCCNTGYTDLSTSVATFLGCNVFLVACNTFYRGMLYHHASFACMKSFACRVVQTAWWVPYAKWWMLRLSFSVVSTYETMPATHYARHNSSVSACKGTVAVTFASVLPTLH